MLRHGDRPGPGVLPQHAPQISKVQLGGHAWVHCSRGVVEDRPVFPHLSRWKRQGGWQSGVRVPSSLPVASLKVDQIGACLITNGFLNLSSLNLWQLMWKQLAQMELGNRKPSPLLQNGVQQGSPYISFCFGVSKQTLNGQPFCGFCAVGR